jgi:hypothetical protein
MPSKAVTGTHCMGCWVVLTVAWERWGRRRNHFLLLREFNLRRPAYGQSLTEQYKRIQTRVYYRKQNIRGNLKKLLKLHEYKEAPRRINFGTLSDGFVI